MQSLFPACHQSNNTDWGVWTTSTKRKSGLTCNSTNQTEIPEPLAANAACITAICSLHLISRLSHFCTLCKSAPWRVNRTTRKSCVVQSVGKYRVCFPPVRWFFFFSLWPHQAKSLRTRLFTRRFSEAQSVTLSIKQWLNFERRAAWCPTAPQERLARSQLLDKLTTVSASLWFCFASPPVSKGGRVFGKPKVVFLCQNSRGADKSLLRRNIAV